MWPSSNCHVTIMWPSSNHHVIIKWQTLSSHVPLPMMRSRPYKGIFPPSMTENPSHPQKAIRNSINEGMGKMVANTLRKMSHWRSYRKATCTSGTCTENAIHMPIQCTHSSSRKIPWTLSSLHTVSAHTMCCWTDDKAAAGGPTYIVFTRMFTTSLNVKKESQLTAERGKMYTVQVAIYHGNIQKQTQGILHTVHWRNMSIRYTS